jgi:hypothetical protein
MRLIVSYSVKFFHSPILPEHHCLAGGAAAFQFV